MPTVWRLNFQHRLFLSYSFLVATILILATVSLYFYVESSLEERYLQTLSAIAEKTAEQVDDALFGMSEAAIQTGLNPVCVDTFAQFADQPETGTNLFESTGFASSYSVRRTMALLTANNFATGRISLFDLRGNYIDFGGLPESRVVRNAFLSSAVPRQNAERLKRLDGKRLILPPHQDSWSSIPRLMVSVLWNIKDLDNGKIFGFVEVQHAFEEIVRFFPDSEEQGIRTYLFSADGQQLYPRFQGEGKALLRALPLQGPSQGGLLISPLGPGKALDLVAWSKLKFTGWVLAYCHDSTSLYRSAGISGLLIFGAGFLILLLSLGVVFVISERLSAPIRSLLVSLEGVDLDNLEVSLPHDHGNNDVSRLNDAFEAMFDRLRRSTAQVILARDHEIKAHLLALQSQMDPHFLFNMLSVISASARELGPDRIAEICGKLATTLRYVSDYEQGNCTMSDEIAHARTYLELQKYRYESQLDYRFDLDPLVGTVIPPKLLLQPIIENCFKHGFVSRRPPWVVEVRTGRTQDAWFVEVLDNGKVIDRDVVDALRQRADSFLQDPSEAISTLKIGGLGLFNSFVRLKLRYGPAAVFEVGPSPMGGTMVRLGGSVQ